MCGGWLSTSRTTVRRFVGCGRGTDRLGCVAAFVDAGSPSIAPPTVIDENELRRLAVEAGCVCSAGRVDDSLREPGTRCRALIGIDRDDRRNSWAHRTGAGGAGSPGDDAPVVAQAWRGAARQARLARLGDDRCAQCASREARAAGELLAAAGTADVVDALLVLLAVPGDQSRTSDPDDLTARRRTEHPTNRRPYLERRRDLRRDLPATMRHPVRRSEKVRLRSWGRRDGDRSSSSTLDSFFDRVVDVLDHASRGGGRSPPTPARVGSDIGGVPFSRRRRRLVRRRSSDCVVPVVERVAAARDIVALLSTHST